MSKTMAEMPKGRINAKVQHHSHSQSAMQDVFVTISIVRKDGHCSCVFVVVAAV